MTKQEIKESLIACAGRLKHVPSLEEVMKLTPVSHRQIVKNFGGYINALQYTGLELKSIVGRGHGVPMEKLFADWAGIVKKLRKLPSRNEYHMLSQYSPYPLMRRVGDDKRQFVKIEFELESRNFLKHRHDPSKCDLIVCWRHNWPECPLEVIELKKAIGDRA